MKTTAFLLALGAAAVLATTAADARGDGKGMRLPAFEALDLNKDGKIDRDEAAQTLGRRIAEADANGDGVITREELRAHLLADAERRADERAARMIERLDTDKDGSISTEELAAHMQGREDRLARVFDRIDRDNDGVISKAEYDRMAERMQRRGEKGQGHRHGRKAQDN